MPTLQSITQLQEDIINYSTRQCMQTVFEFTTGNAVHRGAFCQFTLQWIYYCHSSISTGKETDKTHLCAVIENELDENMNQ